ncbi:hypothetical protein [Bacteroides oleiciplenus]|uniref:Uncharacterized protein n=1 Tax=Bacteroides oleiciplenus YIT 12058 TaxID=742727 RepID=K9EPE8_9BACE|nr:hypothetical protein [Bacteroides oleiciplenus]EKU91060.1 hypothetical protein HMPREF9447_02478 [Bacteroides oleiciplenus YIT 12058]
MKLTNALQTLLLSTIILFGGTACDNENDERISSTGEVLIEGDQNSIEIPMTRTNWKVASVTYPDGGIMSDENGYPVQLEGMGTVRFHWGYIIRDKADALTIQLEDNFEGRERGMIINLSTSKGLYSEQILVRQKECTNFYQIESFVYHLEEGDGVQDIGTQPWGINWIDKSTDKEETRKMSLYPFYNAYVTYNFGYDVSEPFQNWFPQEENGYVDMPEDIVNGKIIFEKEKRPFTYRGIYYSELREVSFEVDLVTQKKNAYRADIYYKRLLVSYTLTLTRSGSDTRKVIQGKLLKESPYDCSPIRHEVTDLTGDE